MNSDSHYYLAENSAGQYLSGANEVFSVCSYTGDDGMWVIDGSILRNATGSLSVALSEMPSKSGQEKSFQLKDKEGNSITDSGTSGEPAGVFNLIAGPDRLPSVHLAELRQEGLTLLARVLMPSAVNRLKAQIAARREQRYADESVYDGQFWMRDGLSWSPDLARAVTHPVALWLLQQYLETDDIHFCHSPVITTLKPAKALKGTFPEGGWHNDYPYHPGVFPDEYWPETPIFGAQFNICVDRFEPANAGTQYLPGSHRLCQKPSIEFNRGGTRMGVGVHKDVRQMEASAGAALLYDSRTWHRGCHELNVSGQDRIALLNAVTPSWVRPMMDKHSVSREYLASDIPDALNARERRDVHRLCNSATMETPVGMPVLGPRLNPKRANLLRPEIEV